MALVGGITASHAQFAANYLKPVDQDLIFSIIKIKDDNSSGPTILQYNLGNQAFMDSAGRTANISQDLVALYGAGWASDETLRFAVIGADGGNNKVWVGINSASTFIPQRASSVSQSEIAGNVGNTYAYWDVFGTATASGLGVSYSLTDAGAVGAYVDATGVDGLFGGDYALSSSIIGSNNIYYLQPVIGVGNAGQNVGTVSLAADGTVTVVPEPSTYVLIGCGALMLLIAYRRKVNS